MSTATDASTPLADDVQDTGDHVQGAPEGRGRLTIADRVVEKIAAQAAGEVDNVTGAPHRVLGVHVSDDPRAPQVSARVDGDVATVSVHLAVTWPAPVLDVTRQVRQRVIARLGELAGITRAQVDIDVTALTAPAAQERRVR